MKDAYTDIDWPPYPGQDFGEPRDNFGGNPQGHPQGGFHGEIGPDDSFWYEQGQPQPEGMQPLQLSTRSPVPWEYTPVDPIPRGWLEPERSTGPFGWYYDDGQPQAPGMSPGSMSTRDPRAVAPYPVPPHPDEMGAPIVPGIRSWDAEPLPGDRKAYAVDVKGGYSRGGLSYLIVPPAQEPYGPGYTLAVAATGKKGKTEMRFVGPDGGLMRKRAKPYIFDSARNARKVALEQASEVFGGGVFGGEVVEGWVGTPDRRI